MSKPKRPTEPDPKRDMVPELLQQCERLRRMRGELADACNDLERTRESTRFRDRPFK